MRVRAAAGASTADPADRKGAIVMILAFALTLFSLLLVGVAFGVRAVAWR
jgi:hypothetical protein